MAGFFFLAALAAVIYLLFSGNSTKELDSATEAILEAINNGTSDINFALSECPLVIRDGERVVAVLPRTTLLEPQTIRVRHGNRHHSSFGTGRHYRSSWGSSSYTSEFAPHDELRETDLGTLVVTDRRVAFMGPLKTVVIDLGNIIGIDRHPDRIAIHGEKEKVVESFGIAKDLTLAYLENGKQRAAPFSGPILERLVVQAMAKHGNQRIATAA
jgi:hypothetical protein